MAKDSEQVTTGGVARALGVTVSTVKNWIAKGVVQAIRLPSGHYRIPRAELDRLRVGLPAAPEGSERERAWRRYEEWRHLQPLPTIDPDKILQWNDRLLIISKTYGPLPVVSAEEKAERVRTMHKALAKLTR